MLDHYETRTRQVPETYISGYSTEYRDLGNGYFESYQVPQYDTRYRTEEYREPIYRQEPVYATLYDYSIQRWEFDRTLTAAGKEDTPYWPQVELSGVTERESGRREQYAILFTDKDGSYPLQMSYAEWSKYGVGDKVVLTISAGGKVQEVKKK